MELAANSREADRTLPRSGRFIESAIKVITRLSPVLDLGIRLWVANVFWKSGLTKIASWDTTLALFENEYDVPLLSPDVAALLGTGAELLLPVLLVFGLGTRFAAAALFLFNIVAVISYPDLSEAGRTEAFLLGLPAARHAVSRTGQAFARSPDRPETFWERTVMNAPDIGSCAPCETRLHQASIGETTLDGQRAIVTGANSGIGESIARGLAEAGGGRDQLCERRCARRGDCRRNPRSWR